MIPLLEFPEIVEQYAFFFGTCSQKKPGSSSSAM